MTALAELRDDSGRARFWYPVAALAGLLALLKGIRLPNRWSATQAQIDYSQGFVKRGLFGQVVAGPLGLGHYARFAAASFLLLALLFVLLLWLTRRSGLTARVGPEILAVFLGCYGVSTVANTVGYLDIVSALLAIVVLFLKRPATRFLVAVPICAVAVMMHEVFLFVFLPVIVLSFLVQGVAAKQRGTICMGVALAVLIGALGMRLGYERPMPYWHVDAMRTHIAERMDVKVRQDAIDPLLLSAADNRVTMRTYAANLDYVMKQSACLLVFGPTVALLLVVMARVLRSSGAPAWLTWVSVLYALAPLAMHAFAFDVARFNGLICWTAFLTLVTVARFYDGPPLAVSSTQQGAAVVVLLLSLASGGLLMWRTDKMFPAYPELKKFKNQLHSMTLAQTANLSD